MCGIAGIAMLDGRIAESALVARMNRAQRHRGPDGDGVRVAGAVGLGHCLLSILDPGHGQQPMADGAAGLVLTYNGEIYNHPELRREIGGSFASRCDTEVLLAAFGRWGIESLNRLCGMFAFAIHDQRAEKLYLVRDRLGIKPLYYAALPDRLVFASEISAVLIGMERPATADMDALGHYLKLQYVPAPLTGFREIRKLNPGHYAELDLRTARLEIRPYWRLNVGAPGHPDEAAEQLDALLAEVARQHALTDVPAGVLLSGGIDSTLVAMRMDGEFERHFDSFSVGFHEDQWSELTFARTVAAEIGCRHHELIMSADMVPDQLDGIVRHFGEPFGDSSALPTKFVSHLARERVKMVFSGDGGDELFAGYGSYTELFRRFDAEGKPRPGSSGDSGALPDIHAWHDSFRSVFRPNEIRGLLAGVETAPPCRPRLAGARDVFQELQYHDLSVYMVDDVLAKVDRMSMASSVEVRVPLLDHRLVEFAIGLPLSARLHGEGNAVVGKVLLKQMVERRFGHAFAHRPKMGFGMPVPEWLRGPLRPMMTDHLLGSPSAPIWSLMDPDAVRPWVCSFLGGAPGVAGYHIWVLLMLKLWGDVHASAMAAPPPPPVADNRVIRPVSSLHEFGLSMLPPDQPLKVLDCRGGDGNESLDWLNALHRRGCFATLTILLPPKEGGRAGGARLRRGLARLLGRPLAKVETGAVERRDVTVVSTIPAKAEFDVIRVIGLAAEPIVSTLKSGGLLIVCDRQGREAEAFRRGGDGALSGVAHWKASERVRH